MSHPVRLYGTPLSNYYNKIKIALLELNTPFEEILWRPTDRWPDAGSPSGKIPFLETPQGSIYESTAILEYLDETSIKGSLYPDDPLQRAHCRECILYIELYIDLATRPLYRALLKGNKLAPEDIDTALQDIAHGLQILSRRTQFQPWLCGTQFTYADAAAWAHFTTLKLVLRQMGREALLTEALPDFDAYYERLQQRPSIQITRQAVRDAQEQRRRQLAS